MTMLTTEKILDDLLNLLPPEPIPVRKVIVGLHWTLVSSQQAGLASTLSGSGPHGHSRVREVGKLEGKSAQELAGWLRSDNLVEASIGMAALNSLLKVEERNLIEANASEIISRESQGKNLVIIGHFPFADGLRESVKNLWVIEKSPYGDDLPAESAQDYLPRTDVVAITSTAIINHSIGGLLSLCRPDARVILLGPSTPLTPRLFQYGIFCLSGTRVLDEAEAVTTIQQGAHFPQVAGTRLVTLFKGD